MSFRSDGEEEEWLGIADDEVQFEAPRSQENEGWKDVALIAAPSELLEVSVAMDVPRQAPRGVLEPPLRATEACRQYDRIKVTTTALSG